jgi:hypothetical protein
MRILDNSKNLFNYSKVEKSLKGELENADFRLALYVFLAAGLISAVLAVAGAATALYMGAYTYDTLSEITDIGQIEIQWEVLLPIALYQVLLVPLGIVLSLGYEGAAYKIFRLTGGRGTFEKQFYISSLVMLSIAFASALNILISVPFFQILAVLVLLGLAIYFVFYVSVKAYEIVHDISGLHAFVTKEIHRGFDKGDKGEDRG